MATLRIASSSLQSAILFAEHKDVVSAYPADFKPSHNLSALLTKSCSFSFSLFFPMRLRFLHLKTCWVRWLISRLEKLRRPACRRAEGATRAAIAVAAAAAAAAAVVSKPSPECSPFSCLACSDGIPGSVPSDCCLAPLPPTLTHNAQACLIVCSTPLLFSGTVRGSEAFTHPRQQRVQFWQFIYWVSSPSPLHIFNQFYTCFC